MPLSQLIHMSFGFKTYLIITHAVVATHPYEFERSQDVRHHMLQFAVFDSGASHGFQLVPNYSNSHVIWNVKYVLHNRSLCKQNNSHPLNSCLLRQIQVLATAVL